MTDVRGRMTVLAHFVIVLLCIWFTH